MVGSCGGEGSQRLMRLARQLRLHNPPLSHTKDPEIENCKDGAPTPQESDMGNPIANQRKRFRPNRAAVLICLFEGKDGDIRVILTKRSSTLSSHSGEVSLPGGKSEETDADDVTTALREAKEEIGLDPSLVEVVSVLESFTTKLGMTVVPVVGILADKSSFNPILNEAEVEAMFDVPLEMFLKDENRRAMEKEYMGDKYLLHFFDYETENVKYVIWAFTAGILIMAASIVYQRPPVFQERRPKFWTSRSGQL